MSSKLFYQPWWSFPYNLYGACQHDPIVQVGHGEANFIFPLCNYRYILLPLLLDPSDYSPCTTSCSSSSICAAPFVGNHTYSFVGQEQRSYVGIFSAVFMVA